MSPLVSILLPYAFDLIRSYIKSTDSSKDDKVLDMVQEGCKYLAPKSNNTLDQFDANAISAHEMIKGE